MIKTERAFLKEMRRMIRCVSEGKDPLHEPPRPEDMEVLAECINSGYLLSKDIGRLTTPDVQPERCSAKRARVPEAGKDEAESKYCLGIICCRAPCLYPCKLQRNR